MGCIYLSTIILLRYRNKKGFANLQLHLIVSNKKSVPASEEPSLGRAN